MNIKEKIAEELKTHTNDISFFVLFGDIRAQWEGVNHVESTSTHKFLNHINNILRKPEFANYKVNESSIRTSIGHYGTYDVACTLTTEFQTNEET